MKKKAMYKRMLGLEELCTVLFGTIRNLQTQLKDKDKLIEDLQKGKVNVAE